MISLAGKQGGFWGFLASVLENHGVTALLLIAVCVLFYKLIWRVWNKAMEAKNEEIERLVKERDKYQSLVFERLLSSNPDNRSSNESDT